MAALVVFMKSTQICLICRLLSLFTFVSCFFYPAFNPDSNVPVESMKLFLLGWIGPLHGHFSWYANLFYIISLLIFEKTNIAISFSALALLLSLSFLSTEDMFNGSGVTTIEGYGAGYYLWISAILILFIGQVFYKSRKTTNKTSKKDALKRTSS